MSRGRFKVGRSRLRGCASQRAGTALRRGERNYGWYFTAELAPRVFFSCGRLKFRISGRREWLVIGESDQFVFGKSRMRICAIKQYRAGQEAISRAPEGNRHQGQQSRGEGEDREGEEAQ